VIYRVKQGDTLISIARLFRTTVLSLQTWNNLSGARIRVGEQLTIYAARAN
jgi:LysM repeat protein